MNFQKILPAALICLLAPFAAAEEIDDVLAAFDAVQASISSLSADFRETTTSELLLEPAVSEGQIYLNKPNSLRWEYASPEPMQFVIASDQYTGYFPSRNKAERRNIKRWSDRIFRVVGIGQSSDELGRYYDIRLGTDEERGEVDGQVLLVLEPRRKRIKRRVEDLRFWVDASSWLPHRIEYRGASGDKRVIEFSDVQLNPDLSASTFLVDLPQGVELSDSFTGLPGFADAATQD